LTSIVCIVFGLCVGIVLVAIGLWIQPYVNNAINSGVTDGLVIKPNFGSWSQSSINTFLNPSATTYKFYPLSATNVNQILQQGANPATLQEVGPITINRNDHKFNVNWNADGTTYSYQTWYQWQYASAADQTMGESLPVVLPNIAYLGLIFSKLPSKACAAVLGLVSEKGFLLSLSATIFSQMQLQFNSFDGDSTIPQLMAAGILKQTMYMYFNYNSIPGVASADDNVTLFANSLVSINNDTGSQVWLSCALNISYNSCIDLGQNYSASTINTVLSFIGNSLIANGNGTSLYLAFFVGVPGSSLNLIATTLCPSFGAAKTWNSLGLCQYATSFFSLSQFTSFTMLSVKNDTNQFLKVYKNISNFYGFEIRAYSNGVGIGFPYLTDTQASALFTVASDPTFALKLYLTNVKYGTAGVCLLLNTTTIYAYTACNSTVAQGAVDYITNNLPLNAAILNFFMKDGPYASVTGGLFTNRPLADLVFGYPRPLEAGSIDDDHNDPIFAANGVAYPSVENNYTSQAHFLSANSNTSDADYSNGLASSTYNTGTDEISKVGTPVTKFGSATVQSLDDVGIGYEAVPLFNQVACGTDPTKVNSTNITFSTVYSNPEIVSGFPGITYSSQIPPFGEGDSFPTRIAVWSDKLYRAVNFYYSGSSSVKGINTRRYFLDPLSFNATYPPNAKYQMSGPSGVLDVHMWLKQLPAAMSMPYFLNGDAKLRSPFSFKTAQGTDPTTLSAADGLNTYGTYIDIEPLTGLYIQATQRIQYNFRFDKDSMNSDFSKLLFSNFSQSYSILVNPTHDTDSVHSTQKNSVFWPGIWVQQYNVISDSDASSFKDKIYTSRAFASAFQIAAVSVGAFFILVFTALFVYCMRGDSGALVPSSTSTELVTPNPTKYDYAQ